MDNLIRQPLVVLILSSLLTWFSAQLGIFLRRRRMKIDEDTHQDHALIASATETAPLRPGLT